MDVSFEGHGNGSALRQNLSIARSAYRAVVYCVMLSILFRTINGNQRYEMAESAFFAIGVSHFHNADASEIMRRQVGEILFVFFWHM